MNPDWEVHALDQNSLTDYLPRDLLSEWRINEKPAAALSDQIRIELLHRYGGVWADATTMCMRSLDEWLPESMESGFFAFAKPVPERMVASWFLAAEKGSYIVERWRKVTWDYWENRREAHDYFWFHELFGKVYASDVEFRRLWDHTPQQSAQHQGHFAPDDTRLTQTATPDQIELLSRPPAPVFKLTHKLPDTREPNSFIEHICQWALAQVPVGTAKRRKKILLGWYGSFHGHGTIGDLRALEAVATHLVARGHEVAHATDLSFELAGARRVDWRTVTVHDFDAVLFVCGPILKSHPQTNEFFSRFRSEILAGVGVSLAPPGHDEHFNPFSFVLAREGAEDAFGDLAIAAPHVMHTRESSEGLMIALVLRGPQNEYGIERCEWEKTETVACGLAEAALSSRPGTVVRIENHLARSGKDADEIEAQYANCDLIITSRFHGAIEALRNNVPFVAIDQIRGGAKVKALLSRLPWPHTYSIDEIDERQLKSVCTSLVSQEMPRALFEARHRAVKDANRTLTRLDAWLSSLPEPSA